MKRYNKLHTTHWAVGIITSIYLKVNDVKQKLLLGNKEIITMWTQMLPNFHLLIPI